MGKDERKGLLNSTRKKSSRSFRGLVTGKSKRDKKKAKEEAASQSQKEDVPASPLSVPETKTKPTISSEVELSAKPIVDDETVYGAEFDDASRAAATVTSDTLTKESESEPVGDPIAIVLLLMDPKTRRFELLQLEFDTTKATVSDILQQIPISATEESLRTQSFEIVCDVEGLEYDHDKRLSNYLDDNAVIITVPKSNHPNGSEHAAKMAKPILRDPKVQEMLRSAGVNFPPPQAVEEVVIEVTAPSKAPEEATPTVINQPAEEKIVKSRGLSEKSPSPPKPIPSPDVKPKSSNFTMFLIIGAVMAYMIAVLVNVNGVLTTPLEPGTVLKPGAWRSRCGFAQSSTCKPAYIEMGIDGTLQVVENNGVTFSLRGNVCEEEEEDCVPGAVIEEDGTLKIGGTIPKVGQKSKTPLNPWPFADGVGGAKGKKMWS